MIEIVHQNHAPKSTVAINCSLVYVQELLPGSALWLHLFTVFCNARPHSKIRGARLPPPPSTPPCRLSTTTHGTAMRNYHHEKQWPKQDNGLLMLYLSGARLTKLNVPTCTGPSEKLPDSCPHTYTQKID